MKVIEMDQRAGEETAVREFSGPNAEREAEAYVEALKEKAETEGKDYLRYWVSD
jgi:hypothetical protein